MPGPPATSTVQLLVAALQNSLAVISGVHSGGKEVADRLENVKSY